MFITDTFFLNIFNPELLNPKIWNTQLQRANSNMLFPIHRYIRWSSIYKIDKVRGQQYIIKYNIMVMYCNENYNGNDSENFIL